MVYDIVYTCNSTNNKNVRGNELKILRKVEEQLYFEFGESENNVKKRFYKNLETLNKDFEELEKIKEKMEREIKEEAERVIDNITEAIVEVEEKKTDVFKKAKTKNGKKKIF
jgi:hypothetical protein